ncbi:MAG TPA: AMP-binding protein [Opitutaceae bacterium]|jgi:acyl-CoA synthetase (AMP-forming)/AMP-acid ligase II
MLKLAEIPPITFVGEGTENILNLAEESATVRWLASRIQADFPDATRLGVIYPTSPELILVWLGVLLAGKEPCLLQYPTAKQSVEYWHRSVEAAIESCNLEGLIVPGSLPATLPSSAPSLTLDQPFGRVEGASPEIGTGAIIQLSSGTTGHRKGIRFTLRQVERHVLNYNQVLGLGSSDVVVSWLPLYHDMGFIACFLMPLLLRVRLVMIDPMTWVRRPRLLLETIARYDGTISYLPNFGFEVLAKCAAGAPPLPTMRRWVSCSEPTHAATMEKFCAAIGTPRESIAVCYGMAENVFAVTWGEGFRTVSSDGVARVSCGTPIPGTEVMSLDGELFVRSDTSAAGYLGVGDLRRPDGYYPTGDLGYLDQGEVVVCGRKRDIMVSAGKKYILSDLDYAVASHFPQSAGRIATLAQFDEHLGSETALFLVEDGTFWSRQMDEDLKEKIRSATGLENFEVRFVPSAFITKTSSGKINRSKTLDDWKKVVESQSSPVRRAQPGRFLEKIAELFPSASLDHPVGEVFDSLGSISIRIACEQSGIAYDEKASLRAMAAAIPAEAPSATDEKVFSIVALVDCVKLGFKGGPSFITEAFLARLEEKLGCKVRFEHVVCPPAPLLFSDLVFHDYFMPRDDQEKYHSISSVIQKLKSASLILIDDEDALRLLETCVYPVLSHRFINHPSADLISYRLQPYTQQHHLLAKSVVLGGDIPPDMIGPSIDQISEYLKVPIMRLAFIEAFRPYTSNWDYTEYRTYTSDEDFQRRPVNAGAIQFTILKFILDRKTQWRLAAVAPCSKPLVEGPPHFCSFLLSRRAIDAVVDRFDSFCIAGLPCSAPYIVQRIEAKGKKYFFSGDLNPSRDDFDCMLCTGFYGPTNTQKPLLEFMQITVEGGRVRNAPPELVAQCTPLVEGSPADLMRFFNANRIMPVGNYLLNQARIRQRTTGQAA